ncbi:hypothetical protein [Flindersiella endophytica]
MEQLRTNSAQRRNVARGAFLSWADYRQEDEGIEPAVQAFFESPHAYLAGEILTADVVDRACEYLLAKGLISGIAAWQQSFVRGRLTDAGIDCVENYGDNVKEYLASQGAPHVPVNVQVSGRDGINIALNSSAPR